jgi:hypothetical protein
MNDIREKNPGYTLRGCTGCVWIICINIRMIKIIWPHLKLVLYLL